MIGQAGVSHEAVPPTSRARSCPPQLCHLHSPWSITEPKQGNSGSSCDRHRSDWGQAGQAGEHVKGMGPEGGLDGKHGLLLGYMSRMPENRMLCDLEGPPTICL